VEQERHSHFHQIIPTPFQTPSYFLSNNICPPEFAVQYTVVWRRGEAYIRFWWGNLRKRDHLEDPGVDRRIILRWIHRKWVVRAWTGLSWLRIGTGVAGTCAYGYDSWFSIKCGDFLTN
jgi:hypothetical protein